MTCRRVDLVLVPFPFTDLSTGKRRPVLCLTNADGFGDFLAAAVTTKGIMLTPCRWRTQPWPRVACPQLVGCGSTG